MPLLSLFPRYLFRKKLAIDLLKKHHVRAGDFLEIGAGQGDFAKTLSKIYSAGEIIEFSPEALGLLTKNLGQTKIKIMAGDFLTYNFDKKYDLIVMFEALEHIEDDKFALKKINDTLNKDGVFLFSVPALMKKWSVTDEEAGHFRRYEKRELQAKLLANNLQIVELYSYGFPFLILSSWMRRIIVRANRRHQNKIFDKQTLTKKSGLTLVANKPLRLFFIILSKIFFFQPLLKFYAFLSSPFNHQDLGDGYLCLVKKINN